MDVGLGIAKKVLAQLPSPFPVHASPFMSEVHADGVYPVSSVSCRWNYRKGPSHDHEDEQEYFQTLQQNRHMSKVARRSSLRA